MGQEQEPVDVTEQLHELLRGIDFAFDHESGEQSTPHRERERCAAALAAIGRFLGKIKSTHADRFFDLSYALTDLDIGARPLIFKVPKRRSTPNSTQIEGAKAEVAFAIDALIALGKQPRIAARELLREFPDIKELAGPKSRRTGIWEKTILEWRKSLSAPKRRKNELAGEFFAVSRELIDFLIKAGRRNDLENQAKGRARHAARIGVFVARSNPR